MTEEALAELDGMTPADRDRPESLVIRISILMNQQDFESAYRMAAQLCDLLPECDEAFISAAYCLHELRRTEEARTFLLSGPPTLRRQAVFHYNMACYECCLGRLDAARDHLMISFQMNPEFRRAARQDRDLEALRADLASL